MMHGAYNIKFISVHNSLLQDPTLHHTDTLHNFKACLLTHNFKIIL